MDNKKQFKESQCDSKCDKTDSTRRGNRRTKGNKEFHDRVNKQDSPDRNSVDWINKSPAFKVAARLPLSEASGTTRTGRGLITVDNQGKTTKQSGLDYVLPGLFVMRGTFTMGSLKAYDSSANLAIRSLWMDLRKKVSGTIPVTLIQLYLYIAAVGQLVAALGFLDRVAYTLSDYKTLNRFTPEALLSAQGFDHADFKDHQSDVLFALAYFKNQISGLVIPKWDYFKDAYHVFHKYYIDSADAVQAQLYMRVPLTFGKYESEEPQVLFDAALDYYDPTITSKFKWSSFHADLVSLFDSVLNDQTMTNVSAFLSRTLEDQVYSVDKGVDLNGSSEVVFDAEDLLKMHNAKFASVGLNNLKVNAGTGNNFPYLQETTTPRSITVPSASLPATLHISPYTLDPIVTKPSEDAVGLCCRYSPTFKYSGAGAAFKVAVDVQSHETFLPYDIRIVSRESSGTLFEGVVTTNVHDEIILGNKIEPNPAISTFSMGPYFPWVYMTSGVIACVGDIVNMQTVDEIAVEKIHTANLLSLFDQVE